MSPASEWKNTDFTNLRNSLMQLDTALKLDKSSTDAGKGLQSAQGPSVQEAEQKVTDNLNRIIASPLNVKRRETYNVSIGAIGPVRLLYRELNILKEKVNPSPEDIEKIEEALKALARVVDPDHPFLTSGDKPPEGKQRLDNPAPKTCPRPSDPTRKQYTLDDMFAELIDADDCESDQDCSSETTSDFSTGDDEEAKTTQIARESREQVKDKTEMISEVEALKTALREAGDKVARLELALAEAEMKAAKAGAKADEQTLRGNKLELKLALLIRAHQKYNDTMKGFIDSRGLGHLCTAPTGAGVKADREAQGEKGAGNGDRNKEEENSQSKG